uniref:CNH domain-containing protein n=1 Tax=Toxocara canis TaxID=6265 RepID=A0A183VHF8_TOXCA
LPTQMNDLLLREKSFATARLPAIGTKNAVALPIIGGKLHLLVATTDGYLYCYQVEAEGGECTLARQHKIGVQVCSFVFFRIVPMQHLVASTSPVTTFCVEVDASVLVGGSESCASPTGTVERSGPSGDSTALRVNDLDEFPPMSHCTD